MLDLAIPGREHLCLEHLVLDYNGTLAVDGRLLPGVADRLKGLAERLQVHVITADTFGTVAAELQGLPVALQVIGPGAQDRQKLALVERLGPARTAAVGNGANDRLMLAQAALGICILGAEGAATPALLAADVVVRSPLEALDLLLIPARLTATLRV